MEAQLEKAEDRAQDSESQKEEEVRKVKSQLKEKEEEKAATQTELDDLLMVFGDLEEKVEKYKVRYLQLVLRLTSGSFLSLCYDPSVLSPIKVLSWRHSSKWLARITIILTFNVFTETATGAGRNRLRWGG